MKISRAVVDEAIKVLTINPAYGGAGFDRVCAEYVVASVTVTRPENVEAIANGSKGVLNGLSFAALREYYSKEPPLRQARIARWVAENVDLKHAYTADEARQLLTDAGEKAPDYTLSDSALIGMFLGLTITHREDALRLDAGWRGEMVKTRDLESALKARGEELAAAQQRIGQQNDELKTYRDKLDGVLANLRKETDGFRKARLAMNPDINLRRHQTLTHAVS